MPPTGVSLPGVFMAGDWLAQGPATHGAKGLSQEKAYVTGLQAGNKVAVPQQSAASCQRCGSRQACYLRCLM